MAMCADKILTRLLITALACLGIAGQVHAAAINLTTPGWEYGSGLYTLGFEFTINTTFTVDSLGVYDADQDGIATPANVAIWLATGGSPIVQATVPQGTAGDLENFFRYVAITPTLLSVGTNYVIGAFLPNDGSGLNLASSVNTGQGGAATIDPHVTIIQDRFSNFDSSFGFPTATNSHPGGAWLGANFRATTTVPEPGSLALLGLGMTGLAFVRRWKATC